jgi:hypothetical protein
MSACVPVMISCTLASNAAVLLAPLLLFFAAMILTPR